jgi:hypothetical protein
VNFFLDFANSLWTCSSSISFDERSQWILEKKENVELIGFGYERGKGLECLQ